MSTPQRGVHLRPSLRRTLVRVVWVTASLTAFVTGPGCQKPGPQPSAAASEELAPGAPIAKTPGEVKPGVPAAPAEPQVREAAGLEYVELILGDASPDEQLPMVVAIHGLGDRPENFAHLFEGWTGSARLILPRGVDPTEDGGYSWFPTRARSVDVDALAAGITSSADKIAAAVAQLVDERPTLGKPTITGFSQGGMLTFALALTHPEVVGYAVAVGGWLPPPLWPTKKDARAYPAIVALHGTADNAVPFEPTVEAVAHLEQLGFEVKLEAFEGVQHAIPPIVRRDLYDRLSDATEAARAAPGGAGGAVEQSASP